MLFKLNHVPIVLFISSNVMGGSKLRFQHIKKGEFGRGNSSRSSICTCYRRPNLVRACSRGYICVCKILSAIHVFEPLVRIRLRIARVN